MTLQQLSLFLDTVRHGSFSAAAEQRGMAQPSVSDQVRRLEAELGVELFVRVGRALALTEAGMAMRPHAERTLAAAEAARESVIEVRELRGGTASFGTFGTSHLYLGPELVEAFRHRHPKMRVRILGQNSAEVVDAIRAGTLEAGLVALPVDDRELDLRPAMTDELLYVSTDAALVRRPMTIRRVSEHPLVLADAHWGQADPVRRRIGELAQRAGVTIEAEVDVEDPEAALALAAGGLGATIIERGMLHALGDRVPPQLGWTPFAEPVIQDFAFVWRRNAHQSPATRALVALAEERLAAFTASLAAGAPRRRLPGPATE